MFAGDLPGYVNTASPRVAGGLGTIPRVVAEGEEIYRGRLPVAEALSRIERIYRPYHRTLSALVDEVFAKIRLGASGRLPFHAVECREPCGSPPRIAPGRCRARRPLRRLVQRRGRPAIWKTCCAARGLRVLRNKPYAGGFITQNYGAPRPGRHALQIEINRALYLDETTLGNVGGLRAPAPDAHRPSAAICLAPSAALIGPRRLAAE